VKPISLSVLAASADMGHESQTLITGIDRSCRHASRQFSMAETSSSRDESLVRVTAKVLVNPVRPNNVAAWRGPLVDDDQVAIGTVSSEYSLHLRCAQMCPHEVPCATNDVDRSVMVMFNAKCGRFDRRLQLRHRVPRFRGLGCIGAHPSR
jgi:hypothetical protein